MEENEDLDLNNDPDTEGGDRKDKRFTNLTEKVRLTAEERDAAKKDLEKADTKRKEAEKELDFFKNFSPLTSKYAGAADFQDKIKEKVMAGYDVEDATISILAKEGRYSAPAKPKESPAGGSATIAIKGTGDKSIAEMSRDERRQAIIDAEAKGEISLS